MVLQGFEVNLIGLGNVLASSLRHASSSSLGLSAAFRCACCEIDWIKYKRILRGTNKKQSANPCHFLFTEEDRRFTAYLHHTPTA